MASTVTVACKVPNGLILRVFDMVEGTEPILGGGSRPTKVARQRPETATIKGFSVPRGPDFDYEKAPQLAGGFALTPGVDADLFELWLEQNKESQLVREGLIFAHEKTGSAVAEAKEKADLLCGLEPLNPDKDPRAPRGIKKESEKA